MRSVDGACLVGSGDESSPSETRCSGRGRKMQFSKSVALQKSEVDMDQASRTPYRLGYRASRYDAKPGRVYRTAIARIPGTEKLRHSHRAYLACVSIAWRMQYGAKNPRGFRVRVRHEVSLGGSRVYCVRIGCCRLHRRGSKS